MPQVNRSIEIRAAPAAVWRWMATQAALRQWVSPNIEIDLRPGGAYRFLGPDNATWISGVVLELVPEREFILSWTEEDRGWVHPARLVITLAPTAAGTQVTLIHDGFAGVGKPGWESMVRNYEAGADQHQILEKLAALVTAGVRVSVMLSFARLDGVVVANCSPVGGAVPKGLRGPNPLRRRSGKAPSTTSWSPSPNGGGIGVLADQTEPNAL